MLLPHSKYYSPVESVSKRRKSAKTRDRKSTGRYERKFANSPRAIESLLLEVSYYLDLINSDALIVIINTYIIIFSEFSMVLDCALILHITTQLSSKTSTLNIVAITFDAT